MNSTLTLLLFLSIILVLFRSPQLLKATETTEVYQALAILFLFRGNGCKGSLYFPIMQIIAVKQTGLLYFPLSIVPCCVHCRKNVSIVSIVYIVSIVVKKRCNTCCLSFVQCLKSVPNVAFSLSWTCWNFNRISVFFWGKCKMLIISIIQIV